MILLNGFLELVVLDVESGDLVWSSVVDLLVSSCSGDTRRIVEVACCAAG